MKLLINCTNLWNTFVHRYTWWFKLKIRLRCCYHKDKTGEGKCHAFILHSAHSFDCTTSYTEKHQGCDQECAKFNEILFTITPQLTLLWVQIRQKMLHSLHNYSSVVLFNGILLFTRFTAMHLYRIQSSELV